jgi:hypothetical protein
MFKIINPLISKINEKIPALGFRFTAEFKDSERANRDATAVREILRAIPGIDGDAYEFKYNVPVTFPDAERLASSQGVESITCCEPSDKTRDDYPHGHVEIVTKNPAALHALIVKALGAELGGDEQRKLQAFFTGPHETQAIR